MGHRSKAVFRDRDARGSLFPYRLFHESATRGRFRAPSNLSRAASSRCHQDREKDISRKFVRAVINLRIMHVQDDKADADAHEQLQKSERWRLAKSIAKQTLDALTDTGSAAAHRGWKPSLEELNTMMSIVEHFLYRTFILGEAAKKLKASVPEKPK